MVDCQASPLVLHLHTLAFYPDNTPQNETIETYFTDDSFTSYVERVLIWGSLIGLVGSVILICNCVCSCCMCGFCYGGGIKPRAVRISLGLTTIVLTIITMSVLSVELWLDVQIDKNIDNYASDVVKFSNSTDVWDLVENVLLGIENQRHITTIVYIVLLLVIMLLTLLSASLAPACKSSVLLFVMLVVIGVVSFITLIMLTLTFITVVLFSDICVGLYNINPDLCAVSVTTNTSSMAIQVGTEWTKVLSGFCNETMTYGFLFFTFGMFVVLLLLLLTMFGLAYAASLTGKKRPEMVILSPNVVLSAYEAPEHALDSSRKQSLQFSEDAVPLIGVVDDI